MNANPPRWTDEIPAYEVETLSNGVRLVVVDMPHVHSTCVSVFVRGGHAYETATNNGVSHLLEHLHMTVTKKNPSPGAVARALELLPGDANATAAATDLWFFVHTAPECLVRAAELLAEVVETREFSNDVIAAEKRVIESELVSGGSQADPALSMLLATHPFALPAVGTLSSVRRLSNDQIRAAEQALFRTAGIVVVVAGKLDTDAHGHVQRIFQSVPPGAHHAELQTPPLPELRLPKTHVWPMWSRFRPALIGFVAHGESKLEDTVARNLIDWRLTGTTSPLRHALRYGTAHVYDFASERYDYPGFRLFTLRGTPHRRDRDGFLRAIIAEVVALRSVETVREWLETARIHILHHIRHQLDSPETVTRRVGLTELDPTCHTDGSICEEISLYRTLHAEDIAEFAASHFAREHLVALVAVGQGFLDGRTRVERLLRAIPSAG